MAADPTRTIESYLDGLPTDRREAIAAARETIVANLPSGYEEQVGGSMVFYVVPLSRYPKTYNKQPLQYIAMASQKSHMALYMNGCYGDEAEERWFREAYKATGKKLDMGKSCVRFKHLKDLPLDVVGEAVRRMPVDDFIAIYDRSRAK